MQNIVNPQSMNRIAKIIMWLVLILYAGFLVSALLSSMVPNFYKLSAFAASIDQTIYDSIWKATMFGVVAIILLYITRILKVERKFFWISVFLLTLHTLLFLMEIYRQGDT